MKTIKAYKDALAIVTCRISKDLFAGKIDLKIANLRIIEFKQRVAMNPTTAKVVLTYLRKDNNYNVMAYASNNLNTHRKF